MGRKSSISDFQKIDAVTSYLNGDASISDLCSKLHVHESSFKRWVMRFKSEDEAGLMHSKQRVLCR